MRYLTAPAQFLCFALTLVCFFSVNSAAVRAAEFKLNQQLAQGQSIQDYKVSPDGKYAAYIISEYVNDSSAQQLFGVNLSTREIKALTPRITDGKMIYNYEITPTNRVIVLSDAVTQYQTELFSVAVTGGTIVRLNRALASGAGIYGSGILNYKVAPDGSRVVYYYYEYPEEGDSSNILYSVPATGGTSTRLTSSAAGAQLNNYIFTPDSRRLVYEFAPNYDSNYAVYSIAVAGGKSALVTDKFYADYYQVTADSQTFVYQADPNQDGFLELYSSPITGGARTQLSLVNEDVSGFRLTNPYSAVVYAYKLVSESTYYPNSFGIVGTDARYRYAIKTGKNINAYDFVVSPDNRGIVFTVSEPGSYDFDQTVLYSVTLDSRGQVRKLSDETIRGVGSFKITPDGSRVVFLGFPIGGAAQIYSVPTIDGGVIKLSNAPNSIPSATAQSNFQITPDGKRVVFAYSAENGVDGTSGYDIFSNAVTGGSARKAAANTNEDFAVAGSSRVVYTRSVYGYDENGNYVGSKNLYTATITQ